MDDQSLTHQWQYPPVFRDAALRLIDIHPGDLFGNPKNKFRREAYIAGEFSVIYDKHENCRVRLTKDDGLYDFELETENGVIGFQVVEADQEGRRRGDEYRDMPESSKAVQVDLDLENEGARKAIKRVLDLKAKAHYSPKPNIAVLVNMYLHDTKDQCTSLTAPWKNDFESIWLLRTPNRILRAWPSCLNLGW